ncbi:MAG: hypothetical protein NTY08_03800 [Proteobacteria bacterium]|jgi:hypothetical protein|nr:hypothetical protein [Pseudomonadota bacterium]
MKPNALRIAAIAATLIGLLNAHPALAGGKNAKGSTTSVPKGTKAKHLTGEATIKSKDQSKIDFEAADIGGERKSPLGTMINQNKADKNYDFVKIRLRWHPEMVQSASALDSGK